MEGIENYFIVIFGIFLILTREWQARKYIEWQKNNFNFNFGKRVKSVQKWGTFGVGMLFIVIGLLGIFGVIGKG